MQDADYQARIDELVELRKARAARDAREARILHALVTDPPQIYPRPDPEGDKQWVREEVSCALLLAPVTAAAKLAEACQLVERLPATLDLLESGEITAPHAGRLAEATFSLDAKTTAAVEERVLKRAAEQTPSQFKASIRRAVLALAPPKREEQRRTDALADRRVWFNPQDNGTTELWALLPAETAAAIQAALDTQADRLKAHDRAHLDGEQRSADQRRADALAELIFGTSSVRPTVNVTVALSTLLALDNQPGELDRHGPIPAALARVLAFDATGTWRRLLTDETGQVLDAGRSTYRPPARIARTVVARQTTCVFPTCRRTAARCELDHVVAWDDHGVTATDNLQPLCPRHHHLKHETGWRVWRLPDGTTRWRSPAGHITDRPPDEIPKDDTAAA